MRPLTLFNPEIIFAFLSLPTLRPLKEYNYGKGESSDFMGIFYFIPDGLF